MFDGRIYRAAFVPLLFVLVIAGFSLASRPAPLRATLAPDAFNGTRAYAGLEALVKEFPDRRPGSAGDNALAGYIANTLRGLSTPSTPGATSTPGTPGTPSTPGTQGATSTPGTSSTPGIPGTPSTQGTQGATSTPGTQGASGAPTSPSTTGGGFQVTERRLQAQTIDGARTLTTVIAERPGSSGESPIAILAHRDAAAPGSAAELSGTAALLELARVLSQSETHRTIVLVSTSGGSGGYAGAADFAQHGPDPLDAAIVLGDLAGVAAHKPFVLPFSSAPGTAPESLQLTLEGSISQEVGVNPGSPSVSTALVHLAFPLATGEQAPLNAAGVPSVLVQVSGERGPSPGERVSATRLLNFGRAVLSATYALDEGPSIAQSSAPRLPLGRKALPGWAIRLLTLALLLPPLLASIDALARLRRRREPVLRWVVWTLTGALPFFTCALFAILLGALGIVAAPAGQPPAGSLSADSSAPGAAASAALVLVLALLAWPALARRLALAVRPSAEGAGLAVMLVLLAVALLTWIFNPFACLLLVPASHLWLLAVEAGRRPAGRRLNYARARGAALFAIFAGALPLILLLVLYVRELGLGPGGLAESVALALAGGGVGVLGALLWSVALGCLLAVSMLAPPGGSMGEAGPADWMEISTRGPSTYAGPGSLGGTESALRR